MKYFKFLALILFSFSLIVLFQNCGGSFSSTPNVVLNAPADNESTPAENTPPSSTAGQIEIGGEFITQEELNVRKEAAIKTSKEQVLCKNINDFYWEIGDSKQKIVEGQIGVSFSETTIIPIASASKMVFGAYMSEKTNGQYSELQRRALTMQSGYVNLNPILCSTSATIGDCFKAGASGSNYSFVSNKIDRFDYDGAHDQYLANLEVSEGGLGWANWSTAQVNAEVMNTLKNPGFLFGAPQLAGGLNSSAQSFSMFLKSVLKKELNFWNDLGTHAVCTLKSACPTADSSPTQFNWHYSINHWVEDDPADPIIHDGSFSSPGAYGFYPWISKDKKFYGLISRQASNGAIASVKCGQKIRAAFLLGTPQLD